MENNLEDIIGGELRYVFYPSLGLYAYAANWQSHSLYMICFNSTLAGNFFGRNGGDAGGSFNGPNFVPAGQVNNGCVWQNNAFYTSSSQAAPLSGGGSLLNTTADQYLNNIFLSDQGVAVCLYRSCTGLAFTNNFVESGKTSLYGLANPISSVKIESNLFNTLNSALALRVDQGSFDNSSLSNNIWMGSTQFQHGTWSVNTVGLLTAKQPDRRQVLETALYAAKHASRCNASV